MIWAIADRNRKIDINYMEQIITTTVVTLISGAIGAIIGTYGGALFAAKRQEKQLQYLQPIITQYFIDNKSEIWLLFLIAHSKR